MKLIDKKDLTRWNRAGLSQFQYIDGNAITYLETLRQKLQQEYTHQDSLQWTELATRFPELNSETAYQTSKRLKQQYYDDRRDYAWEIVRTFSRSAHVLGEYINAYANEAYLPTAVEWNNVRKLVALLDYRPSPPASAETYIALLLKPGESGIIEQGFAVKNKPAKGESTVIFETRQKLEGNALINNLHLKDWNKNPKPLIFSKKKKKSIEVTFLLQNIEEDISVGDKGILATDNEAVAVKVNAIQSDSQNRIKLKLLSRKNLNNFTLHNTTLYLHPSFVDAPLPNGINSAIVNKKGVLSENEIIFGKTSLGWQVRKVIKNELGYLQFNESTPSVKKNEQLFRARTLTRQRHPKLASNSFLYLLPTDFNNSHTFFIDNKLKHHSVSITSEVVSGVTMRYILANLGQQIYYPDTRIAKVGQANQSSIRFSGKAPELASSDWALVEQNKTIQALRINTIEKDEDWFEVHLNESTQTVNLLRASFKTVLKHRNFNINNLLPWHSNSSDSSTVLELENASLANSLTLGQKLICASDKHAVSVELKEIQGRQLYLYPAFHKDLNSSQFTKHNSIIYANAVAATHGETQTEKIVGNGDASKTNQRFPLSSDNISWVSDASFNSGVRADLTVRVGQRIWQQVERLSRSAAEDFHYSVKVDEDNKLSLCFGDGKHARRLPTGIDNVRVRYRNGYGEEGNLPANSLFKVARPHSLVKSFIAPIAASGGAQKEAPSSMRENAPATVLTLGRAVSIDDFTHLAAHHSMVWQARAFEKIPDRPARLQVQVVIVAAGGSTFTSGSDTASLIQNFLIKHALPDTPISVVSYQPILMQLKLTIMVDETSYDKDVVKAAVFSQLQQNLQLKQRKLGQALFRSEIIGLLEQVEGVENGHCEISPNIYSTMDSNSKPHLHTGVDGKVRKVSINPDQLIYLDTSTYPLQINCQTYEP
ncbi:MAG: hypothetical protein HN977_19195 [Gammaproteobacteria bacterium]|nr:hypothetical protein [Gammaproteobacteria bacterium]